MSLPGQITMRWKDTIYNAIQRLLTMRSQLELECLAQLPPIHPGSRPPPVHSSLNSLLKNAGPNHNLINNVQQFITTNRPYNNQQILVQKAQIPQKHIIPYSQGGQSQYNNNNNNNNNNNRNRYPLPPQGQGNSPYQQQQNPNQKPKEQASLEDYYYDEEEQKKPDRLTVLLKDSKFTCGGKKDGYYADESLNCEVFHYCQEGTKHSWMCPNSFAFHQVHLICVPPSNDNICKQSSNFHFVNEYLYLPINEKEAQATNSSLRYADRYYPQGYNGYEFNEVQVAEPYPPRLPVSHNKRNQNVFYSPESINIPLNNRRPQAIRPSPSFQKPNVYKSQSTLLDDEYYDDYKN